MTPLVQLSPEQIALIAGDLAADQVLAAIPQTSLGAQQIADAYNAAASPVVKAWRSLVTAQELDEASDYSAFDSIVAGKRDAWRLFLDFAPRDFRRNKARKVVTDVWGPSNSAATIAFAIYGAATREITRAEKLLGGTTTATEGTSTGAITARKLDWEGKISAADIERVRSV